MKLQRYKPRHKKQNTFVMRISSMASVFVKQLKIQFKKSAVQAATFLLILSMATVAAGEYGAPFAKAIRDKEAAKLGLEQKVLEVVPIGADDGRTMELRGYMPMAASAEVIDVTEAYAEATKNADVLAAFDITINNHDEEYQPNSIYPIDVEVPVPGIERTDNTQLWHIKDDGTKERILDFTLKKGILSFSATGFSVYEIVEAKEPGGSGSAMAQVNMATLETLTDGSADGFYLSYGAGTAKRYFTNTVRTDSPTPKENGVLIEEKSIGGAAKWYFEKVGDNYKIYTYADTDKVYIHRTSGNNIELSASAADQFVLSAGSVDNTLRFKKSDAELWLQHSGGGNGIRYYNTWNNDDTNRTNSSIYVEYETSTVDDYLELDGNTYGLMDYKGETQGQALVASDDFSSVEMLSYLVRQESGRKNLFVDEGSGITMWSFTNTSGNHYKISASVGGSTKYLKANGDNLSFVDDVSEATEFKIESNSARKIQISTGDKAITFANNAFSLAVKSIRNEDQWLNLVTESTLSNDDYVTYYADKISVSEAINGEDVIVYTRVWNQHTEQYDFYAIDHDGTLYPCYERGDNIMWLGGQIDTLSWTFTEYLNEDGTPNNYYELYNAYSKKYIAPQIENNQVLSDSKIGISLTGRKNGEYHSDIVAWDEAYYAYSGLQNNVNAGKVVSGPKADASTFYFAKIAKSAPGLTEVETVDHEQYGVIMRMVDFPDQGSSATNNTNPNTHNDDFNYQNYFLSNSNDNANIATKGILSNYLGEDGYPTVMNPHGPVTPAGEKDPVENPSLSVLFNQGYKEYKRGDYSSSNVYVPQNQRVNHIFLQSVFDASGYFEFDSSQNFATVANSTPYVPGGSTDDEQVRDITVYKELGAFVSTANRATHKHGQFLPYNTITAGVYTGATNPENIYDIKTGYNPGTLIELPETDPRKYEKLHKVIGSTNYYNGMEMSCSITQSASGKDAWGNDIVFEFTGDDDFWFYVDRELVLDLGGIHSALSGSVNFSTGVVNCNGVIKDLRQIYRENYISRNPGASATEINDYLAQFFVGDTSQFKAYTTHEMRVFYMERGAGASNLHMRFNLNSVTPGNVMLKKEVTGSDDVDFNIAEYPYQIWYKLTEESDPVLLTKDDANGIGVVYQNSTQKVDYLEHYTAPNSTVTYDSVFLLSPDKIAEICFPENPIQYQIIECGVNNEVYKEVLVNDIPVPRASVDGTGRSTYDSGWATVRDRPVVVFSNRVNPEALRTLEIEKCLYNKNEEPISASDDTTVFNFRLFLSNGVDDNLSPAYMTKYYVKNRDGYFCKWDPATKRLVPTVYVGEYKDLIDSQKDEVTFETSMNGAISKIPAGYSICVPNLLVGTRFKVEEWDNEIPLGYSFWKYERVAGTYISDEGDPPNSGWVRLNDSPKMRVDNKRGWGIEVDKVWSDSDFVKSHDNIYTAIYVGDESAPLSGTIRQMPGKNTSIKYWLDSLGTHAFEEYKVYEVVLGGSYAVDADTGFVTPGQGFTVNKIDGQPININAVPKNSDTSTGYAYTVDYERGTPSSSTEGISENIRTDTITNTRGGGIVLSLFDMRSNDDGIAQGSKTPVAGGTFTLMKGEEKIGDFTTDSKGRITVLYEIPFDTETGWSDYYTLTQTDTSTGYIGLEKPIKFRANTNTNAIEFVTENDAVWYSKETLPTTDDLIAFVNVYNKPFEFQVRKCREVTDETVDAQWKSAWPCSGAHFELYCERPSLSGPVRDTSPMSGYEDLVTGTDGYIPKIDNTLEPGRYYLAETAAPQGFEKLNDEIVFVISDRGEITIESTLPKTHLISENVDGVAENTLYVPNKAIELLPPVLTINNHVDGTFGDKTKQFVYTFNVNYATLPAEGCEWYKNGVKQTTNLHNGDRFTLADGDTISIGVEIHNTSDNSAEVKITEVNNTPYTTTSTLNGTANPDGPDISVWMYETRDPYDLDVTNTFDAVVPTGIFGNSVMPFVVLLAVMMLGYVVYFVVKRRKK